MATSIVTTNEPYGNIELHGGEFRDELLVFAATDTFVKGTILGRITASGKLAPFATGASNGSEVPVAVLTYDVSRVGAGDVAIRALEKGVVNKNRLVIDADGDGSNITNAILDQLRDMGIVALDVAELGAAS